MQSICQQIAAYVDSQRENILRDIRTVVDMEGHYEEKENVEKVQQWFRSALEAEGFSCHVEPVAPDRAGLLIGMLGEDRPDQPVLFSGHLDTVFHTGEFRSGEPFRQEGDRLTGPGVHDMKSGAVMALYTIRALNEIGWNERPIKVIFVGEEESDHIGNHADDQIVENSRGCLCAFNMESGIESNALCVGRKCQLTSTLTVHGKGGHAGNDYQTGRSAILETMRKLEKIDALADWDRGTTVAPTIIHGGTHNSSIPAHCETVIDVRVFSDAEEQRIRQEMARIAATPLIDGTSAELSCEKSRYYGYSETPQIAVFHAFMNEIAQELGCAPFGKIVAGGAADSGNIAHADVPVLCAFGIRGGCDHSKDEYAILSSAYERIRILAYAVTQLDRLRL